ncbi:20699_t:CDS:2 [Cetraspora pellucida]|uniref:20699_t:CDS:1 n=1 Tax=Cetraspora pellucida TaxID=1433469 RepID=A0A9N9HIW2_9GLOM|nr:20699_t:CDS:2 [Cetraspora pellucida]
MATLNDAPNDKASLAQSKIKIGTVHLAMQERFRDSSTELEPNRTDWHNILEEELNSNNTSSQGLIDVWKENASEHLSENSSEPSSYPCIEDSRHITKNKLLYEKSNLTKDFLSQDKNNLETILEIENSREYITKDSNKNTMFSVKKSKIAMQQ